MATNLNFSFVGRPESLIQEYFDPGRPDALMELTEKPDGREFTFFHKATLDGMVKRIETFTRNRQVFALQYQQTIVSAHRGIHFRGLAHTTSQPKGIVLILQVLTFASTS